MAAIESWKQDLRFPGGRGIQPDMKALFVSREDAGEAAAWMQAGALPFHESVRSKNRSSKVCRVFPMGVLALSISLSLMASPARAAVHYQRLKSFGSAGPAAADPRSPLIQGSDGALYGTTYGGSTTNNGTVFKLSQDGTGFEVLHSFGKPGDGAGPQAGLLESGDGLLYGTTTSGGTNGYGTVFTLRKDGGDYRVLYHFGNGAADGRNPWAALVQGNDGALYGTTYSGAGGANGTVFKLNPDGSGYQVLHRFGSDVGDGQAPYASLLKGSDGVFYGTTYAGGSNAAGTVFALNEDGSGYRVVRSFSTVATDGKNPWASLIEGSDGALYGTTYGGGSGSAGTVFRLNKDGSGYAILRDFTFDAYGGQGHNPEGALVEGRDGALYGTTLAGGTNYDGTVFSLSKNGTAFRVLRHFAGADGWSPYAGLLVGADGALYGTASGGGGSQRGVVFRLSAEGFQGTPQFRR